MPEGKIKLTSAEGEANLPRGMIRMHSDTATSFSWSGVSGEADEGGNVLVPAAAEEALLDHGFTVVDRG